MDRTHRAALMAAGIGLVSFGGLGAFLGFDLAPSLVTGLVMGALFGGLILAAARRADSFPAGDAPPSPRSPHGRRGLDASGQNSQEDRS